MNKINYICTNMVKKNLYISLILIAIMSMVSHAFIPHHNHTDTICFTLCEEGDSADQTDKKQTCSLDNQEIIQPQSKNESEYGCSHGLSCDIHFPPIMLFIGDFFDLEESKTNLIEKPYLNLYTSAGVNSLETRRGPPQI